MTALHSCLHCGRHPDTHVASGDDRCEACGLGDERVSAICPIPPELDVILTSANVSVYVRESVSVALELAYVKGRLDAIRAWQTDADALIAKLIR